MENFQIIRGFRNVYDVDRLRISSDILLSCDSWISFLKENSLKGLTIYLDSDKMINQYIDLSFLKEISFLEYFECIVPLSKKSDITGIYALSSLKNLRWIVRNNFDLDFSMLESIKVLSISYYEGLNNWSNLVNLKKLYISKINRKDCVFISNLKELTDIQIHTANIFSIEGLECCHKLERLELIYCSKIKELSTVLIKCPNIISVSLKKCKNISKKEIENIEKMGISLWVE
jgi:hypothetical protein